MYFLSSSSELLRVIDSLQMTATKKVATPADWEVRMTKKVLLNSLIKSLHSFIYSFTSKIVTKNPHFHVVTFVRRRSKFNSWFSRDVITFQKKNYRSFCSFSFNRCKAL